MVMPQNNAPPLSSDENAKEEPLEEKEALTNLVNHKNTDIDQNLEQTSTEDEKMNGEKEASSSTSWKVGDLVDGKDLTMGAWFEAEIKKISFDENGHVSYHVIYDGYDETEVV